MANSTDQMADEEGFHKITACVITRNEEQSLERCLKSLSFADEILVIDAVSTDRTAEIAKKYAHKFLVEPWKGFTHQRNLCLKHATHPWVFFLDADEEVSELLARRLKKIAKDPMSAHPNCYSVKRVEFFLGKELHYGPGNPSFQWRFFKKDNVSFVGDVHEYPRFEGAVGLLLEPILHWPDLGIEKFLNKLNHYTTLEALDRFAQGQKTSLFHAFFTFFSTFLKNGIRYRGFLNGKEGFVLILLESFSRVVRHLKLWVYWQIYAGKIKINLPLELPVPGSTLAPDKRELEKEVVSQKHYGN